MSPMKPNAKNKMGANGIPLATNAFWKGIRGYTKHTVGEDRRKKSQLYQSVEEEDIYDPDVWLTLLMNIFVTISFLNVSWQDFILFWILESIMR